MKVYTKTGDDGTTSLIGGTRVSKCNERLEVYGTLDELDSFIGLLKNEGINASDAADLNNIQEILTGINACFACPNATVAEKFPFDTAHTTWLEGLIDKLSEGLPPIDKFLIPGSSKTNAIANICRTVCRRAERCACALELCDNQKAACRFINRLSDYLFVLGRRYEQKS